MSYLFPDATKTDLGVVQVGANIDVDANSVISIPQSVATTATVTFGTVNVTNTLTLNGASVITSVTPAAGPGISITNLVSTGTATSFTVNNTGVTSIVAGTNISINTSTGAVTVNAAAEGILQTIGTGTDYTATATDEYIGVTANPTTVTLPTGVTGKTYIVKNETTGNTTVTGTGGQLLDNTLTKSLGTRASISLVFRAGAWRII
jgi:hypothetical protein